MSLIDVPLKPPYTKGHVDGATEENDYPIKWWGQEGLKCGVEVQIYPEGNLGASTRASAEKAIPGVESVLDFLERLVNDILDVFPPGKLPPAEEFTQRSGPDFDAVMKQPFEEGWKHLFTLGWPPTQ